MNSHTAKRLVWARLPVAHRGEVCRQFRLARPSVASQQRIARGSTPITISPQWCRQASSNSAEASSKQEHKSSFPSEAVTTPLDATSPSPVPLNPDIPLSSTLNPPASTRPPPVDLPVREPDSSLFSYLFKVGKTYIAFYKSGLKAIYTNRQLLQEVSRSLAAPPHLRAQGDTAVRPTRAATLLRERTTHDLARLPVFGLLLLVCGEFTPLVVLALPKLTPYTCRIPRQVAAVRRSAQARRDASRRNLELQMRHGSPAALEKLADGHVVRVLGLGSSVWDRVGFDPPFAAAKARRAVRRIAADDRMIRDGGGVRHLDPEEVVLACEERAMDVRHDGSDALRRKLDEWIRTTTREQGEEATEAAVKRLLT